MWKWKAVPYLLFVIILLTASISSIREKSITFDEVIHLPAGYTYLATGDFRLNPEHPPFVKVLSALPLLFLNPKADFQDWTWKDGDASEFGYKFLYEWNDADRLVFWGRLPSILLSVLFGLCISACAKELYGEKAGYIALILYLFTPDLIAHGQLVTTDLAAAGFLFLTVYTFYRTLRQMTWWNILFFIAAFSLALISKYSCVFLFPILAFVAGAYAYSKSPVNMSLTGESADQTISSRRGKFAAAMVLIIATALVGLVVIWGCYQFRYRVSDGPVTSNMINSANSRIIDWQYARKRLGKIVYMVRIAHSLKLVPEGYLHGFYHVLDQSRWRPNFLLGDIKYSGWRHYFLVSFLVKTPIPFMILVALGVILMRRYGEGMAAEAMLLIPVILYWGVALTSHMNIGNRHLLPIYPFLIVFASKLGRVFDSPRPRLLAAACALLIGWNVVETASVYPHFLAYFNQIAGGPSGGYRWLVDSNLDWGQDLKGLAKYRREHPDEPFYVSYFGTGNPSYYGLKAHFLPCIPMKTDREYVRFDQVPSGALVAVSATNLQCVYNNAPGIEPFMQRLRDLKPVAEIGYSIKIYRYP